MTAEESLNRINTLLDDINAGRSSFNEDEVFLRLANAHLQDHPSVLVETLKNRALDFSKLTAALSEVYAKDRVRFRRMFPSRDIVRKPKKVQA